MDEKKKSNIGLIVIVIVLLVALTGVGVYLLCDRFLDKDKLSNKNNIVYACKNSVSYTYTLDKNEGCKPTKLKCSNCTFYRSIFENYIVYKQDGVFKIFDNASASVVYQNKNAYYKNTYKEGVSFGALEENDYFWNVKANVIRPNMTICPRFQTYIDKSNSTCYFVENGIYEFESGYAITSNKNQSFSLYDANNDKYIVENNEYIVYTGHYYDDMPIYIIDNPKEESGGYYHVIKANGEVLFKNARRYTKLYLLNTHLNLYIGQDSMTDDFYIIDANDNILNKISNKDFLKNILKYNISEDAKNSLQKLLSGQSFTHVEYFATIYNNEGYESDGSIVLNIELESFYETIDGKTISINYSYNPETNTLTLLEI